MDFLDYLNSNKNDIANAYEQAGVAQNTAADLDAKRMQNKATAGIMNQFASDPTTQFIAMHPEVAGALISTQQFNMKKKLQQGIINQLGSMPSDNGASASYDPQQQQIMQSVGMDKAPASIGANPATNLPALNVNTPTSTNDDGSFGNLDAAKPLTDSTPNLDGGSDSPQPAAPEQVGGGQGGPAEEPNPANEYNKLQSELADHRNNASKYAQQAVKEADFYNKAKIAGLDVTNAKSEALQSLARNEMDQASQKLQQASTNPKIIAQKNAVDASSKVVADAQQAAVQSQLENEKLATLKNTIKDLPTGAALPARQKLGEYLSGFGFDPAKHNISAPASEAELVKSGVLDQVFASVKQAVGGRVSGQEMNTFYQKLPSLLMTPEGNTKIIDFMQAANSNAPAYYKAAQQWMGNHNNDLILSTDKNGDNFNDNWVKSREGNNVLKQYQKNQASNGETPISPPEQKPLFKEGDMATNSKTGKKITFKDGKWQ